MQKEPVAFERICWHMQGWVVITRRFCWHVQEGERLAAGTPGCAVSW